MKKYLFLALMCFALQAHADCDSKSTLADCIGTTPNAHKLDLDHHVSPVPETDTWAMMLAGIAAVGFVVKRKSRK